MFGQEIFGSALIEDVETVMFDSDVKPDVIPSKRHLNVMHESQFKTTFPCTGHTDIPFGYVRKPQSGFCWGSSLGPPTCLANLEISG